MSKKKIVVPDGMLKAAQGAISDDISYFDCEGILEAALRWQDAELKKMYDKVNQPFGCDSEAESNRLSNVRHGRLCAIEDVRRMFLAPEPEVPEEIKDLMDRWGNRFDEAILQAYRRGLAAKEKK